MDTGKAGKSALEHFRLKEAVVEAARAYCAAVIDAEENGYPKDVDNWHFELCRKQTTMIDAYKVLESFEAAAEQKE